MVDITVVLVTGLVLAVLVVVLRMLAGGSGRSSSGGGGSSSSSSHHHQDGGSVDEQVKTAWKNMLGAQASTVSGFVSAARLVTVVPLKEHWNSARMGVLDDFIFGKVDGAPTLVVRSSSAAASSDVPAPNDGPLGAVVAGVLRDLCQHLIDADNVQPIVNGLDAVRNAGNDETRVVAAVNKFVDQFSLKDSPVFGVVASLSAAAAASALEQLQLKLRGADPLFATTAGSGPAQFVVDFSRMNVGSVEGDSGEILVTQRRLDRAVDGSFSVSWATQLHFDNMVCFPKRVKFLTYELNHDSKVPAAKVKEVESILRSSDLFPVAFEY